MWHRFILFYWEWAWPPDSKQQVCPQVPSALRFSSLYDAGSPASGSNHLEMHPLFFLRAFVPDLKKYMDWYFRAAVQWRCKRIVRRVWFLEHELTNCTLRYMLTGEHSHNKLKIAPKLSSSLDTRFCFYSISLWVKIVPILCFSLF